MSADQYRSTAATIDNFSWKEGVMGPSDGDRDVHDRQYSRTSDNH